MGNGKKTSGRQDPDPTPGNSQAADPIPASPAGGVAPADVEDRGAKPREYPGVKVRAIRDGYYGDKLRRVDDVFVIDGTPGKKGDAPAAFSDKWMEYVDARTPERLSTNNDVIRRQHDEARGGPSAGSNADATGNSDPLGSD